MLVIENARVVCYFATYFDNESSLLGAPFLEIVGCIRKRPLLYLSQYQQIPESQQCFVLNSLHHFQKIRIFSEPENLIKIKERIDNREDKKKPLTFISRYVYALHPQYFKSKAKYSYAYIFMYTKTKFELNEKLSHHVITEETYENIEKSEKQRITDLQRAIYDMKKEFLCRRNNYNMENLDKDIQFQLDGAEFDEMLKNKLFSVRTGRLKTPPRSPTDVNIFEDLF